MFNLRSLDLNLLTVFDALMREQHLTRAADRLNMSQPAVSNALSRLRVQLRDPLFVRTSKGMLPTAKATQLYGSVRQALEVLQQALSEKFEFDPRASRRKFALSMNDYGEQMFLPLLMMAMRSQAPGLQFAIELETGESLRQRLQQGTLDVAFDYMQINGPEFMHEAVGEEELVVVASAQHPELSDELSLEQYLALPHVTLKTRDRIGTPLEIVLGRRRLNRNTVVEVPHLLTMPAIVATTDMLCTIPRRLAEAQAAVLPLCIYSLPLECPAIPVYMIWHASFEKDGGHCWLRESLQKMSSVFRHIRADE